MGEGGADSVVGMDISHVSSAPSATTIAPARVQPNAPWVVGHRFADVSYPYRNVPLIRHRVEAAAGPVLGGGAPAFTRVGSSLEDAITAARMLARQHNGAMGVVLSAASDYWVAPLHGVFADGAGEMSSMLHRIDAVPGRYGPVLAVGAAQLKTEASRWRNVDPALQAVVDVQRTIRFT